jgi:two-component system chemotaxis response regulator CheB
MPAPLEDRPRVVRSPFDVVAIAASLGGLRALSQVLSELPASFPAPIIVVQHLSSLYPSHLDELLAAHTRLSVKWAQHGELVRPGHVYLAPPNHHLAVSGRYTLRLSQSPQVNYSRPAADPLFLSIATHYRQRALGVILTGGGSDGALGAQAIKQNGGYVLAQDQASAEKFDMPEAAILTGCVDLILPLSSIASTLVSLVMVPGAAELLRVHAAS